MFEPDGDVDFTFQSNTGGARIDEVIKADTDTRNVLAIPYKVSSLFYSGPIPEDGFPSALRVANQSGGSAIYIHEENTSGVLDLQSRVLAQKHLMNAQQELIEELTQPLWQKLANRFQNLIK